MAQSDHHVRRPWLARRSNIAARCLVRRVGDRGGAGPAGQTTGGCSVTRDLWFQPQRDDAGFLGRLARFGSDYPRHLPAAVRTPKRAPDIQRRVFVVLLSATVQGSTLPLVARRLGLTEKPPASPAATLEISSLQDVDAEIVEYTLGDDARAAGRLISQMALPEGVVVAMITRGSAVIPPRGSTRLEAGDHLFVVLKPNSQPFVDCVFSQAVEASRTDLPSLELRLKGSTKVEDVWNSYGIELEAESEQTLDHVMKHALDGRAAQGRAHVRLCLAYGTRGDAGPHYDRWHPSNACQPFVTAFGRSGSECKHYALCLVPFVSGREWRRVSRVLGLL